MIEINKKAPEFCLKNQNNQDICLKYFKGNWVVLYFYPKDNTPGCSLEAKDFTDHVKEFEEKDAKIIGISPDSLDSHKKFEKKHRLSLNLLSDSHHETLKHYDAWKPKKLYGREFMGVVRSTFLIDPEGNIAYIWPKVKVIGHVQEVMNKLMELKK
jgi:peroxiredoxin Q/BCP